MSIKAKITRSEATSAPIVVCPLLMTQSLPGSLSFRIYACLLLGFEFGPQIQSVQLQHPEILNDTGQIPNANSSPVLLFSLWVGNVQVWREFLTTTFALHIKSILHTFYSQSKQNLCPLSHKYSRFPWRDILLQVESSVMVKASCSGTGWELVLNRNTQRDLFRALHFPRGFLNPWAVLSKEPYATSRPTIESSLSLGPAAVISGLSGRLCSKPTLHHGQHSSMRHVPLGGEPQRQDIRT